MDVRQESYRPMVHVIDDDDSFRTSLTRMLLAAGFPAAGYRCAGEFLVARGDCGTGCILLDISMPGPSGVDLLQALAARGCALPVIFITGYDDVLTSVDVMKRGALDYLVKPVSAERILPMVRTAMQIDAHCRRALHALRELRGRFETLTLTEKAIFDGVLCSKLNKQLAADLGSCERTVKAQRARMFEKLHVRSVPELVAAAKMLENTAALDSKALAAWSRQTYFTATRAYKSRPESREPIADSSDACWVCDEDSDESRGGFSACELARASVDIDGYIFRS